MRLKDYLKQFSIKAAGVEVRSFQALAEDEVIRVAAEADAVLTQYAKITARVLDALPRCRIMVRYGVGVDNIDVDAATRRGSPVGERSRGEHPCRHRAYHGHDVCPCTEHPPGNVPFLLRNFLTSAG
jgi:hypothetical protein